MVRFIHTADWQIGMRAHRVAQAAEQVRAARLEAVRRLVEVAREQAVDFILVAGDVFEDNLVDKSLAHRVAQILEGASPTGVYILPGNHDPLTADSIYNSPAFTSFCPPNVRILRERRPEPVGAAGQAGAAVLLPAPVRAKRSFQDPMAAWKEEMEAVRARGTSLAGGAGGESGPAAAGAGAGAGAGKGAVRIGVAHGSLAIEGKYSPDDHPIALDTASVLGLDYLALGHWHSFLVYGDRTVYPGTLEPDSFEEAGEEAGWDQAITTARPAAGAHPEGDARTQAGGAVLVTIAGPGSPPQIEPLPLSVLRWTTLTWAWEDGGIGELKSHLAQYFQSLPEPNRTLVRLELRGFLSADDLVALEDLETWARERVLYFELDRSGLEAKPVALALDELARDNPLLAAVLQDLEGAGVQDLPFSQGDGRLGAPKPEDRMEAWRWLRQLAGGESP